MGLLNAGEKETENKLNHERRDDDDDEVSECTVKHHFQSPTTDTYCDAKGKYFHKLNVFVVAAVNPFLSETVIGTSTKQSPEAGSLANWAYPGK